MLVEIHDGLWITAENIREIAAYETEVKVYMVQSGVLYSIPCDNLSGCRALAAEIAKRVNKACETP